MRNRPKEQRRSSLFTYVEQQLQRTGLFSDGLPIKYAPYALFLFALSVLYIGNNHYHEKLLRKIDRLEVEVAEAKVDYTTMLADYMSTSKQSEIAKKVKPLGLVESKTPPVKVKMKQDGP